MEKYQPILKSLIARDDVVREQKEILVPSTYDGTLQPSLFYAFPGEGKKPLLVGLHTWSYDRFNQIKNLLPFSSALGFHLLLPEFRGKNSSSSPHCSEACGSPAARQDIRDAIDHVVEHENVDRENIFLLGASGGGHMALMMAGFCPELFRCVSAFVPITDLKRFADDNPNYRRSVYACCLNSEEEMLHRSPRDHIDEIALSRTKIFHGKQDPVVNVRQSIDFYQTIMDRHPDSQVYLDIFEGGHRLDLNLAYLWIMSQYQKGVATCEVTG